MKRCRHLVFVLGDQLDEHSTALADVDPATDIVLMAEVPEESRHVWYWTGNTQMNCMKQVVGQTLKHGYAHHIQRLMVTGIFGLLAEIEPKELEDWYLAVYIDAIEWVELPNVAGMALFADGGRFTSKPYVASGQYIKRMSNYCVGCRYRPEAKIGNDVCPFTTLYWHFLDRHEKMLAGNPRTSLMAKSIASMPGADRAALRTHATMTLNGLHAL